MRSATWVKLFRHIPPADQDKLMLVTTGGVEIAIQCFLRLDAECLALRGRLAGSTDAGRVFFVPYSHIDYFGFQQPVKESEFHDLFGSLELPEAAVLAEPAPAAADPAAPAPPNGKPGSSPRNPLAIKSTVLEKFRARTVTSPGTQLRPPADE
jgi:hypothetical protein